MDMSPRLFNRYDCDAFHGGQLREDGSRVSFSGFNVHICSPNDRTFVGFLAGWAMIFDYFLIPLESVIYAAITATGLVPMVPYSVWVVLFTAAITFLNVRGIRLVARANTAMMIVMTGCALLFIGFAVKYVIVTFGITRLISPHALIQPETLSIRPLMLGAAIATLSYIGFDANIDAGGRLITQRKISDFPLFWCAFSKPSFVS